jgi:hypothetical protein
MHCRFSIVGCQLEIENLLDILQQDSPALTSNSHASVV